MSVLCSMWYFFVDCGINKMQVHITFYSFPCDCVCSSFRAQTNPQHIEVLVCQQLVSVMIRVSVTHGFDAIL